ncbi:hypothetical protein N7452_010387 [Penicillium brevicompactum]|uniref:Uncharacterized protein n=1 Tax=Penicillium brevicompactum TaxID=5074 RepID=A0A9W9QA47_PENBR|nr:hypothetical protein N7452_010387 [Penicillium brevicompactum]
MNQSDIGLPRIFGEKADEEKSPGLPTEGSNQDVALANLASMLENMWLLFARDLVRGNRWSQPSEKPEEPIKEPPEHQPWWKEVCRLMRHEKK